MDHRNSPGRPHAPQRPPTNEVPAAQPAAWSPSVEPSRRRKKWLWPVTIVATVLVIGLAAWWLHGVLGSQQPAADRYQAVFLNNGQVFFGKLKNVGGEYLTLEKAYYTKKADVPKDATDEQKAAIENNISLARVGNEVYGPETTMSIRASQVLFWQDLKEDSKVSKAIENADE